MTSRTDHRERQARRQILLTRIAIQRLEWRQEAQALRRSVSPAAWLRALLGTGGRTPDNLAGWAERGLGWLRRYRVAAALFGGLAPLLRKPAWRRRALRAAAVAVAGFAAWRLARRDGSAEGGDPPA